jgi:hypothetical protein
MPNGKKNSSLAAIGLVIVLLVIAALVEAGIDLTADPAGNTMPISWEQTYSRIIISPDESKLEQGKIIVDVKKYDDGTVVAQSIGLIEAAPEECARVAQDFSHYTGIMPYTVEGKVVRRFRIEGESAGADAVDFWTRVSVLGFQTRYLIRVVHLASPERHSYRSFWTLVRNPAEDSGCRDSEGKPCENDLYVNIGSGTFEPYKDNPNRTMHTYTLRIKPKSWTQSVGFRVGGGSSMQDVTKAIRKAVIKKQ